MPEWRDRIRRGARACGVVRVRTWARCRLERRARLRAFRRSFNEFSRQPGARRLRLDWSERAACLDERTESTHFDRHYVYHPAWAARILEQIDPRVHVDIGSSLFFVSVLSAFVPVRFYDLRPAELRLSGLETRSADLTRLELEDRSIESLSCMHVVEHVGLGRYGDRLDADADLKAMSELQRVLRPGGNLLFVVPVGAPRVVFNAHRIYSLRQVIDQFSGLALKQFALIPRSGPEGLIVGASEERVARESYGCGCFWFTRAERDAAG